MRILVWHVHGSWTTAFVRGRHTFLVPVTPGRGADGRGRAQTFEWPDNAVEVEPDLLRQEDVDVVVLQRPHEIELTEKWLGRRPGIDVPAVYVEHDTPRGPAVETRHPLAERSDIPLVHVTHFNEIFWDSGRAPSTVIEHGIVDPGHRFTGELPSAGVVVNDPIRRGRLVGTDLLPRLAASVPLDVFGMRVADLPQHLGTERITAHEDLPQREMHAELARRRVYAHPFRWTSLGLSLLEAMLIGMPVVVLASTAAVETVPPEAGVISTRPQVLAEAAADFAADVDLARETGAAARAVALRRHSLHRFLADWDELLQEVSR
ncbi:Glycosyl transferases group 1 [Saccharopolyspora kobensis]|uniref:Glycosyl transferases group 1 n=1 Tax=Saccharopolyspora kobensis TaxID=146035 RepID=A0A1H6AEI4_9PSEU|nr:glycosyltransferase family 4 protein [Saccharopolyspora kobensis]SEG46792.1 Glycosyl transferases group 1 [Saccharopolyspora kobensis]SFE55140.1 Glycosyl transferases group 1 [Saccharopolyspora kobensis]